MKIVVHHSSSDQLVAEQHRYAELPKIGLRSDAAQHQAARGSQSPRTTQLSHCLWFLPCCCCCVENNLENIGVDQNPNFFRVGDNEQLGGGVSMAEVVEDGSADIGSIQVITIWFSTNGYDSFCLLRFSDSVGFLLETLMLKTLRGRGENRWWGISASCLGCDFVPVAKTLRETDLLIISGTTPPLSCIFSYSADTGSGICKVDLGLGLGRVFAALDCKGLLGLKMVVGGRFAQLCSTALPRAVRFRVMLFSARFALLCSMSLLDFQEF
ncbi:hypothetical protein U1Q18_023146 [Sarracenia purpurea var. burkii]